MDFNLDHYIDLRVCVHTIAVGVGTIKTGTFGQPELFDLKLIQLIFGPGVENRIFV